MNLSTKERIIETSIDLFSKNGYAETSIRDIAKYVGIKTSSIYYYFESKEYILENILKEYVEILDFHKRKHKWHEEKSLIISGELDISVEKLMSYLFFYFDEKYADRCKKMLKIICSESVRNINARNHQYHIVTSSYQYIKSVLDTLIEAGKIPPCNTAKLSTVLYSISFAFMHLTAIDMTHMGEENYGTDMFSPIEYVLNMVLEGNFL